MLLVSVPQLEATIGITVTSAAGATVLSLTGAQVTGLIALKALAVSKGRTHLKSSIETLYQRSSDRPATEERQEECG